MEKSNPFDGYAWFFRSFFISLVFAIIPGALPFVSEILQEVVVQLGRWFYVLCAVLGYFVNSAWENWRLGG